MASLIGEMTVTADGKEYNLRLGMLGIAKLQDEYGTKLEPILGIKEGDIPHFGVLLRVVQISLEKHHPDDANMETAEVIMSENMSVAVELVQRAFPDAEPEPAKKRKAASRK